MMTGTVKENAAGKGGQVRSEDGELQVVRMMLEHRIGEVTAPCRYLGMGIPGKGTASANVLRWKEAWYSSSMSQGRVAGDELTESFIAQFKDFALMLGDKGGHGRFRILK